MALKASAIVRYLPMAINFPPASLILCAFGLLPLLLASPPFISSGAIPNPLAPLVLIRASYKRVICSEGMYSSNKLSQAFSIPSKSSSSISISSILFSCSSIPGPLGSPSFWGEGSSFSFSPGRSSCFFLELSLPSPSSLIELRASNLFLVFRWLRCP